MGGEGSERSRNVEESTRPAGVMQVFGREGQPCSEIEEGHLNHKDHEDHEGKKTRHSCFLTSCSLCPSWFNILPNFNR